MARIQCKEKGCEYKPSEHDTLEGYCMMCAGNKIRQVKQLQTENARLRKALEWFKTDLAEIKTMNEPTFFTICQRWLPHIDQALSALADKPVCERCNDTRQVGEEETLHGRSMGYKECPDCPPDDDFTQILGTKIYAVRIKPTPNRINNLCDKASEACARLDALKQRIEELEKELEDVQLELSTPSTLECATKKEPLYKWAALIVCEKHQLESQLAKHDEAIRGAWNLFDAIECAEKIGRGEKQNWYQLQAQIAKRNIKHILGDDYKFEGE